MMDVTTTTVTAGVTSMMDVTTTTVTATTKGTV